MKSHNEIKKGLECCKSGIPYRSTCAKGCPYKCDCSPSKVCASMMMNDALALIQQLGTQNAELSGKIGQLEAERDAAVACIPRVCKYCKHDGPLNAWGESECEFDSLFPNGCLNGNTRWEWRGVQKEETDA